jgi:TetR/AcrR family transcriptional regulator, regulator of mycofactocin system
MTTTDPPMNGRDRRREATRDRLLDAGIRLFAERGYAAVTAAEIADAAGVTERTFFRHFPTKTDLILTNWRRLATELQVAMAAMPDGTPPIEVVRAGVGAFAAFLMRTVEARPAQSMGVYAANLPVLSMLDVVLALEHTVSGELGRRLGRSDEDRRIRMVANASIGLLRAAGRAYALGERAHPLTETAKESIDDLRPLFEALQPAER